VAVWSLGAAQCVFWGVLYYGFAVWLLPLQSRLGVGMVVVATAYSLGLLVAAVLAPRVGRGFDLGHGRRMLRLGLVAAVAGLVLLAWSRSVPLLFLAWLGIGTGMALLLYESAFALVHGAIAAPLPRLRALAAVTVVGGLASTIFLPMSGAMVEGYGLRASLLAGAAWVLAAGLLLERAVLPPLLAPSNRPEATNEDTRADLASGRIRGIATVFTSGTVAGMALTTLLVPHLVSRGVGLGQAATVLAALGLAQLPGRLWLLRGGRMPTTAALTTWPMVMQASGLLVVAASAQPGTAAAGVALFGLGAGLHTLARPWLVQERFGREAGHRNGQVARMQGFGRALAPMAAVGAATVLGTPGVLLILAGLLLALVPLAGSLPGPGERRRRATAS